MTIRLNIPVELSVELNRAVEQLSTRSGQPVGQITEDALAYYVSWRTAQLDDLQQAIDAAGRGEFATDEEVSALFTRYGAAA